jgi:PelA/Pel-15E family pectate lyase
LKKVDRVVRPKPQAVLWARYYEIGTNRPVFVGRDGVRRYALAEIDQERRTGYAWYGDWPARLSESYAQWASQSLP